MPWLAVLNRLPTCDRTQKWSTQHPSSCVLCTDPLESRNHLFFACSFSEEFWKGLTQNLLADRYTNQWEQVLQLLLDQNRDKTEIFLVQDVFQVTLYAIWRERNQRKHGERPTLPGQLIKLVDKNVRKSAILHP